MSKGSRFPFETGRYSRERVIEITRAHSITYTCFNLSAWEINFTVNEMYQSSDFTQNVTGLKDHIDEHSCIALYVVANKRLQELIV